MLLVVSVSCAEALDVIKVVVTGDKVNIRSAPRVKGKVYRQSDDGECFFVDPVPIKDNDDNSEWYKILFWIDAFGDRIYRADKSPANEYSNPYISAKFVKKEPFDGNDEYLLDDFAKGRPAQHQVGDDLSINGSFSKGEGATIIKIKTPLSLYQEPRADAHTVEIPAGTIVILGVNSEGQHLHHMDMDDEYWFYVVDESIKLIGFVTDEQMTVLEETAMGADTSYM